MNIVNKKLVISLFLADHATGLRLMQSNSFMPQYVESLAQADNEKDAEPDVGGMGSGYTLVDKEKVPSPNAELGLGNPAGSFVAGDADAAPTGELGGLLGGAGATAAPTGELGGAGATAAPTGELGGLLGGAGAAPAGAKVDGTSELGFSLDLGPTPEEKA